MLPENTSSTTRTNALTKSKFLQELEALKQEILDNPSLPAKVAKQRINALKQQQELALRELAAPAVAEVLAKALQLALSGDRKMIEFILSLHISKPAAVEEENQGRSAVQITINDLTLNTTPKPPIPVEVIDVSQPDQNELSSETES